MTNPAQTSKPWYKEPWPWLLATMPVTAVIAGGFTLWFAITSDDGLVVDDYYKEGKAINQTIERDKLARSLGISAQLSAQDSRVLVQLSGRLQTPPGNLTLQILHPTRSGDDHTVTLSWDGSAYAGTFPQLASSHYRMQITPEFGNWRLIGEYQPGSPVNLTPQI